MTHARRISRGLVLQLIACAMVAAMAASALAAQNAQPEPTPWNVTGVWEGQFFSARLEAHLEQGTEAVHEGLAKRISGVVYSIGPGGGKTTYHIAGLIFGNTITGIHGSGHSFKGTIIEGRRIEGVLTLASGTELPLCATRRD
ncbi:MAG: hypothetical protein ACOCWR_05195 [Oceanidesulfovibrio sp.]